MKKDDSSLLSEKQLESVKLQLKNMKLYERAQYGAFKVFEQSNDPCRKYNSTINNSNAVPNRQGQFNILELLAEFGLKHSKSQLTLTPRDLVNTIRTQGYKKSFYIYKINTTNVMLEIDEYLKPFNITHKSLNIDGNTRFHNILTKYES